MLYKFLFVGILVQICFQIVPSSAQSCPSNGNFFTASSDQYLLNSLTPLLNPLAVFDGPASISGAALPVPTNNVDFTLTELEYYTYISASTYCPYSISSLSCCYCEHFNGTVSNYAILQNSTYGTLALITVHPSKNEIVVTYRGSVSVMNFLFDFYDLSVGSGIRIHRGQLLSTMSLYNQVVTQLSLYLGQNPTFRVVFNGHSLGGDMASITLYFLTSLAQFPGTSYALVTQASPRTGNQAYANYMNNLAIPMARVVARADIVPHSVPVNFLGLGGILFGTTYVHHSREVWINGNVTTFCSHSVYEDFSCSNSLGPGYTLLDHGQYFGANIFNCYFVEGYMDMDFLTVGGFTPTNYMPPMPTNMQNFFTDAANGGYEGILPLL